MSHRKEAQPTDSRTPSDVRDVRAIESGTLFYNLIRYTVEGIGLGNVIHEMDQAKQAQKLIVDPPPLARMKEVEADLKERIFIITNEINKRFAALDEKRRIDCGIEVVIPAGTAIATVESGTLTPPAAAQEEKSGD